MKTKNAVNYKIIDELSKFIKIKRLKNNHRVFVSDECPFCENDGLTKRKFRYNSKLKTIRCFACNYNCNELNTLKKDLNEILKKIMCREICCNVKSIEDIDVPF
jgi:hypothetical protein